MSSFISIRNLLINIVHFFPDRMEGSVLARAMYRGEHVIHVNHYSITLRKVAAKSVTVEMEQNLVMLLVDAVSVKTMWRSVYQMQKLKEEWDTSIV